MRNNNELQLKNNTKFQNLLNILLIGYLNYAKILENMQESTKNPNRSPKKILFNGMRIANKYLGESSSISQIFIEKYQKKENFISNNERKKSQDKIFNINKILKSQSNEFLFDQENFFLQKNYQKKPKIFKISSNKSRKFNQFQKSTDAAFFKRKIPKIEEEEYPNSHTDNFSNKTALNQHMQELQYALADLQKAKEEYYKEKELIESGRSYGFLRKTLPNEMNYFSKPYIHNTPTSFMNPNSFKPRESPNENKIFSSSPLPSFKNLPNTPENEKLKEYISNLERENEKLKQAQYLDQRELNIMKENILQLEIEKNSKKSEKYDNTLMNIYNEMKIFNPVTSPISDISGNLGFIPRRPQKFEDHGFEMTNGFGISSFQHPDERNKFNSHFSPLIEDEKTKNLGKYAKRESRNFKLNLEKLIKLDENNESDEVIQRKAMRYKANDEVVQNADRNTVTTMPPRKPNELSTEPINNKKLYRATASIDIHGSSANNVPIRLKSQNSNSFGIKNEKLEFVDVFEFFGISSAEKFMQHCSFIILNGDKNDIYQKNVCLDQEVFTNTIAMTLENEVMKLKICLFKQNDENAILNHLMDFSGFFEKLKNFDFKDTYSHYSPLKCLNSKEEFFRFCVFPFISVISPLNFFKPMYFRSNLIKNTNFFYLCKKKQMGFYQIIQI